jgi:hypothetical protein
VEVDIATRGFEAAPLEEVTSQSIADDLARVPMSPTLAATLVRAADHARRVGHARVGPEHMLLALTEDSDAVLILQASAVAPDRLAADVTAHLAGHPPSADVTGTTTLTLAPDLKRVLEAAAVAAQQGRRQVSGAILLAAIIGEGKTIAAQLLRAQNLTFEHAIKALQGGRLAAAQPRAAPPPRVQATAPAAVAAPPPTALAEAPAAAADAPPPPDPVPPPPAEPQWVQRRPPQTLRPETVRTPPPPPPSAPPPAPAPQREPAWSQPSAAFGRRLETVAEAPPEPVITTPWPSEDQPPAPALPPTEPAPPRQPSAHRTDQAGQLIENIPRNMRVGVPVPIEVRLVMQDVDNLPPPVGLEIDRALAVQLTAPDGGFRIEAETAQTQWIESAPVHPGQAMARWRWTVIPERHGRGHLQLSVAARWVGADGVSPEVAAQPQAVVVLVKRNRARALGTLAKWAGVLAAGAVIGALAGHRIVGALRGLIGL